MFGNSQSYNNIFGGIQESHQRLFGGDRMLSTKDIEGAQPRKFHRHVWGNYQPSQYQNPLSYEPQKSTIKSPILGDNVQPLNRAIPNSSGLIFRDPNYSSVGQKMYTGQNYYKQPQNQVQQQPQKLHQNTEPTPKMNDNLYQSYTAVNERKSNQNNLNFSSVVAKDSKNQVYQLHSPNHAALSNQNALINKVPVRKIEPPSQLREQNIFSLPEYSNRAVGNFVKPIVNVQQGMIGQDSKEKSAKGLGGESPSNNNMNIFNTSRSPDAYVQFDPTPKDYQRTSVSSYALGQMRDQAVEKYVENKDLYYQQPSKSPVFKNNRNYGQDDVLSGPFVMQNQILTDRIIEQQQQQQPSNNQLINVRPLSNRAQIEAQGQQGQLNNMNNFQEVSSIRPPSNQIQQINNKQEFNSNPNANNINDNFNVNDKLLQNQNQDALQKVEQIQERLLSQSQALLRRPASNTQIKSRPQSNGQQFMHLQNGQQGILYPPQSAKSNQQLYMNSSDTQKLRSVLSSRAKLLLNQQNIQTTANAEYGLYASYLNQGDNQGQKEKILYQSKRDNFLRSHLQRSQSAEGQRFTRLGESSSAAGGVNPNQNNLARALNSHSNLKQYGQWGVRNYNIIGNYMQPYRYEGRKGDPFAEKKYLDGSNSVNLQKNNDLQDNQNQLGSHEDALRKSGQVRSPIAGKSNMYSETNRQFNFLYHQQQQPDTNQVKFFGAKALKNLNTTRLKEKQGNIKFVLSQTLNKIYINLFICIFISIFT